jgi:5-methylcytosine-specific restriction endonuclease McrA
MKIKPKHIGYQTAVEFTCDNCGTTAWEQKSHFERKNRHFCSMKCYSDYRKTKLPLNEQHAYKGIRKENESKQIYHKRYCKNNPESISHLKARRYAKEKNAKGSHTLKQWNDLKDSYGNICVFCGSNEKLTKDHIIPLSKGGSDYIENIQPLCRSCNSKKYNHIYENQELLK